MLKFYKLKHCHLTVKIELINLPSRVLLQISHEMRWPGLVLILDRHVKIYFISLTHLGRWFHRVLFHPCHLICQSYAASVHYIPMLPLLTILLFSHYSLYYYSATTHYITIQPLLTILLFSHYSLYYYSVTTHYIQQ